MSTNTDKIKELVNSYRNLSNHLFVLIITMGVGVINFAIKKEFVVWFFIGIIMTVMSVIIYVIIKIAEFNELSKLEE
ncbi:MAG: hypothetical protein ABGW74_09220 [Campylobacterales bacterium]